MRFTQIKSWDINLLFNLFSRNEFRLKPLLLFPFVLILFKNSPFKCFLIHLNIFFIHVKLPLHIWRYIDFWVLAQYSGPLSLNLLKLWADIKLFDSLLLLSFNRTPQDFLLLPTYICDIFHITHLFLGFIVTLMLEVLLLLYLQ
jgi:hypothetical protein